MAKKNETKNTNVDERDSLLKEINSFIKTNSKIDVESLEEHDFFPDFLDTGNYALNWAISGKLKGGFPCTKVSELFGDPGCLDGDTEIEISLE